jgi:hypothetical protein
MLPSIHPFPARMAPGLALDSLRALKSGTVLDPMTGSGTVARLAKSQSLDALGFDLDPLAVLISKVATTTVEDELIERHSQMFVSAVRSLPESEAQLEWIDGDTDAERYVEFWFGDAQRAVLRKIACLLSRADDMQIDPDVADVLRVALSRIIVTKKSAASLAQDTSHSRPHRVATESDYDVLLGFEKSVRAVRRRLLGTPNNGSATIRRGDARDLSTVADESVDAVLTSPPYLNAIDYMRGHRMSLIWLGHRYGDLSRTRSESIGSERRPDLPFECDDHAKMKSAMGELSGLQQRHHSMIERYVMDMHKMMSEVARTLKPQCTATFVMGNSCLKGTYIENSEAVAKAGELLGLGRPLKHERELPNGSRYLPTPDAGALSKRMRKEVILTFTKQ